MNLLFIKLAGLLAISLHSSEIASIHWLTPKQAATLGAVHKPFLYDFTAAWCGPCKRMDKELFHEDSIVRHINKAYIPVRIMDRFLEDKKNTPEIKFLQRKYKITAFPTLILDDGKSEAQCLKGYPGNKWGTYFLLHGHIPRDEDLKNYQAKAEPGTWLTTRYERIGDTHFLFASNGSDKPITINLYFTTKHNTAVSEPLPYTKEIPAGEEVYLVTIKPIDPGKKWNFYYRTVIKGTLGSHLMPFYNFIANVF